MALNNFQIFIAGQIQANGTLMKIANQTIYSYVSCGLSVLLLFFTAGKCKK